MSDDLKKFEEAVAWISKNVNRSREGWHTQFQNCPTHILEYIADYEFFPQRNKEIVEAAQQAMAERILLEKL